MERRIDEARRRCVGVHGEGGDEGGQRHICSCEWWRWCGGARARVGRRGSQLICGRRAGLFFAADYLLINLFIRPSSSKVCGASRCSVSGLWRGSWSGERPEVVSASLTCACAAGGRERERGRWC